MALVEKLGTFYLGKEYDPKTRKVRGSDYVYYDARDLTTHAVCVGMTGSGKTGLCICLLEEAALDKVPALIIDPKGDMTNLLLTFPELRPEDFQPWVNPDDAARKGMSVEEYAEKTATDWREGLASWEEEPERIRALKEAADFTIYTPGSEAGIPVNVLSGFAAPHLDLEVEAEALHEQVLGTVSALLGLAGIEADPLTSREHILLSTILEAAWREGRDMDLPQLIQAVQKPPFRQVGVMEIDAFYPEKERFQLALALNNIVAAPSFATWMKGDPLDIASMLFTAHGQPRHSIFYIAHLSDAERMFFVTLLLNQLIAWMRAQSGTTSLRCLLYMDEVFGFFPPSREPPSKRPMLTLLKQGRAFGVGVVLTTQNPVDLDYKGLSNAGTWFVGKLQAERDKLRLLDGLEGALGGTGALKDRSALDKAISGLESRVFLLHNVHEEGSEILHTRWAMSYLRGPLTRTQIKQLMADKKTDATSAPAGPAPRKAPRARPAPASADGAPQAQPPLLPPGTNQVFLPVQMTKQQAERALFQQLGGPVDVEHSRVVYRPLLVGPALVRFTDQKRGLDQVEEYLQLLPLEGADPLLNWVDSYPAAFPARDLEKTPVDDAAFDTTLPEGIGQKGFFPNLQKGLADHLYRTARVELAYNPALKLSAKAGESERDFRARGLQIAREQRDAEVQKLRTRYEKEMARINASLAREEQELARDKAEYQGRVGEEIFSGLSGVFSLFGGRRKNVISSLSRASTRRRMSSTAKSDIAESEAQIAALNEKLAALDAQMQEEITAVTEKWAAAVEEMELQAIAPTKSGIDLRSVALGWAPHWELSYSDRAGRNRVELLPAYPGGQDS